MTTAYPHTDSTPTERFVYWIEEREVMRKRKERGMKLLTKDPILRTYRFCNVHREDDRVTRWIAKNWRNQSGVNIWHAMVIARFLNWPPTLAYCGYPEPWPFKGLGFSKRLKQMEDKGMRIFTGAYIVSTNGAVGSKVDHVVRLFGRSWGLLHRTLPLQKTCQETYDLLSTVNGIGSFMAAQVVADLKYTPMLTNAKDWMDFVAPGPGSQRGLNRILGYGLPSKWNNTNFQKALIDLRSNAAALYRPIEEIHLQDLQNCLCEFDKYERVLHDQGRPRSMYNASNDPMP